MRIVPATPGLVPFLVERMTAADREVFCEQVGPDGVVATIQAALARCSRAWCAMDDGGVAFLVAAVSVDGGGARLWGIRTVGVRQNLRASVRCLRVILAEAAETFGWVGIEVPAFQTLARQAERSGFLVGPATDSDGCGTMVCMCIRRHSGSEGLHHG